MSSQPIPQMPAARPAQPVSSRYAKARLSAALPSPDAPQSATPVTPAPCQPQPALNVTRSTPAAAGLRTYVNAPPPTPKSTPPRHPSYPQTRVSSPTALAPEVRPKTTPPRHPSCPRRRVSTPITLAPQIRPKVPAAAQEFFGKNSYTREPATSRAPSRPSTRPRQPVVRLLFG